MIVPIGPVQSVMYCNLFSEYKAGFQTTDATTQMRISRYSSLFVYHLSMALALQVEYGKLLSAPATLYSVSQR